MAAYIIPFKGFEKGFIHAVSERVRVRRGGPAARPWGWR